MLDTVWRTFHFDFRGDLELRMNLARHIVPLSVRMRYGLGMGNPLLDDIKVRYALAYSMATESVPALVDAFGGDLSEEEIGYIALAYALALERARTQPEKKSVLVVCASGRGSAHLLEYRIRQQFEAHLDRVETCDASRVAAYDFRHIDYVFTTVPLDVKIPVPVCSVPYFFDERDVRTMMAFLMGEGMQEGPSSEVLPFFSPDLFRAHLGASTRDEVLHTLCSDLSEAGLVPPEYEELVFRREEVLGTAFGGGIALPHAIQACSDQTIVNVALLDNPVDWGGQQVQVVLLISFSRDPEPGLQLFYQCVAQLFSRANAIVELLDNRSFTYFSELLSTIEKQLTDTE